MTMIEVSQLTKRFGQFVALDDLSFSVDTGEALAFWGANGAGKTTAVRCLLKLFPFVGTITVGGLDVRRMTLQEITFIGTYTYTPADFVDTAQAIFDGRLGALDWMDVRPLSDGFAAFQDIRAGKVAAPKIILKP